MRVKPLLTRMSAICVLLAGALSGSPAEAGSRGAAIPGAEKWNLTTPLTQLSQYTGLAVGLDGRVWVTDLIDKKFLIFDSLQKFTTISSGSFVPLWMTRGSDGNLYINEGDTLILKLDPKGNMTTITVGQAADSGISTGPDGSVWVPEESEVGRIFPDGTVREYPVASGDMIENGTAITEAAGGDVWFDAYTPGYVHYLGSMNPNSGVIRKHTVNACGTGNAWPIVAGPDGHVWVVCGDLYDGFEIDGFGTGGGVTRVHWPARLGFDMVGGYNNAVAGPDNAIWIVGQNIVNDLTAGGAILRFDLVTHNLHKYLPPNEDYQWANGLTFDAHGNIWAGTGNGQIQEVILH